MRVDIHTVYRLDMLILAGNALVEHRVNRVDGGYISVLSAPCIWRVHVRSNNIYNVNLCIASNPPRQVFVCPRRAEMILIFMIDSMLINSIPLA